MIQKCKRYLKLAFKYLVLFRCKIVSLVPFGAILTLPPPPWDFAMAISVEEGKSGSSRASNHHQKSRLGLGTRKNQRNRRTTLTLASPTSTTVYKWKRRLQRLTQLPQKHDRTQRQSRHRHLERIHRPLLELGQPLPERMRLNAVKAIHHQEIHRRQRGRNCGEWKRAI